MSLIQSYRLRRPPLQRNPPNDTQSWLYRCDTMLVVQQVSELTSTTTFWHNVYNV